VKTTWVIAFGLLLLFEGIIPFLFPKQWRDAFTRLTQFSDGQIRFLGLVALMCGLAMVGLARLFD
jgi:uncharacterized protein YjeT (DUF2065 family)